MICCPDSTSVAWVGVAGALIGSIATSAFSLAGQWYQRHLAKKDDQPRKVLLHQMLSNQEYKWRSLNTLMHVIGTDEETAKKLLLEIGARASENGEPKWGLISRNPLPGQE